MMNDVYKSIVDLIDNAKARGLAAIAVYKPDVQEEQGEPEWPDVIVCTHNDPNVIAALLGNVTIETITETETE